MNEKTVPKDKLGEIDAAVVKFRQELASDKK
jgi:hypothetical protein